MSRLAGIGAVLFALLLLFTGHIQVLLWMICLSAIVYVLAVSFNLVWPIVLGAAFVLGIWLAFALFHDSTHTKFIGGTTTVTGPAQTITTGETTTVTTAKTVSAPAETVTKTVDVPVTKTVTQVRTVQAQASVSRAPTTGGLSAGGAATSGTSSSGGGSSGQATDTTTTDSSTSDSTGGSDCDSTSQVQAPLSYQGCLAPPGSSPPGK
jgi:uncharacterized membrane protein YgcG